MPKGFHLLRPNLGAELMDNPDASAIGSCRPAHAFTARPDAPLTSLAVPLLDGAR